MAKKKSAGKSTKKRKKTTKAATARRAGTTAKGPRELDLGDPPTFEDPKAQAEYFLEMLDAFAQQGTPEAKRIPSFFQSIFWPVSSL